MVFLQLTISVFEAVSIIALQFLRLSYVSFPFSTIIEVKPEQPQNALSPMLVTLLGMVTEVREEQEQKAETPMLVTLFGMVTEVRDEQLKKASSPMLVTLLGMVTEVREKQ